MLYLLGILGTIIIVVLGVIAYRLQSKVYTVETEQRIAKEALEKQQQEHKQYLTNSIRVLGQGIIDKQLSFTEASIRISVLLDNLQLDDSIREEFSAFYQLAEATAHIPILQAWKELPAKKRFQYDKERMNAEEKYGDFVVDAAQRLKARVF